MNRNYRNWLQILYLKYCSSSFVQNHSTILFIFHLQNILIISQEICFLPLLFGPSIIEMLLLVNGHVQILPQQMVKGNVWFKEAIYTDDQCIWYFMIRILNDLHWKERVTWSATIWFVLWDLIHECNRSRFPLFKNMQQNKINMHN